MSIAQKLYDEAFTNNSRDPRSDAYKRGVKDALRYKSGELPSIRATIPYDLGTAERDAWYAGLREGYDRWRKYCEESA